MIHFANISTSKRLQSLLAVLNDKQEHSTFDIQSKTSSCAVHSDITELRRNGFGVERIYRGRNENGRQMNYYRLTDGVVQEKLKLGEK